MNGKQHRVKHAVPLQNVFRHIVQRAEAKRMLVNTLKTTLLCISDATSYKADAYIQDDNGNQIGSSNQSKVLGFTLSDRPGAHGHVDALRRQFRQRLWILRHLRALGFYQGELVTVYTTVIRLLAKYCAAVYHPLLTDEQEEHLERLQDHALKIIFGTALSARKLREQAGIIRHTQAEKGGVVSEICSESGGWRILPLVSQAGG